MSQEAKLAEAAIWSRQKHWKRVERSDRSVGWQAKDALGWGDEGMRKETGLNEGMAWREETGPNERLTGAGDQVQASAWEAWDIPVSKHHHLSSYGP